MQVQEHDRPTHYNKGGRDLFDELWDKFKDDDKTYTGREVFIEVMKFTALRYIHRYPNKNPEDLDKGRYTLKRLDNYLKGDSDDLQ